MLLLYLCSPGDQVDVVGDDLRQSLDGLRRADSRTARKYVESVRQLRIPSNAARGARRQAYLRLDEAAMLEHGPVMPVSMYAGWDRSVDGRKVIFAHADADRLLLGQPTLISHTLRQRIHAAGDLNLLHRHGEGGDAYWGARYASVFDRAEALGLVLFGPFAPNGRIADPRPTELPDAALDVPTYHTRAQGPAGAQRQLDFVFASRSIADRVEVRALNGIVESGPSDHCRVTIEVG